MQKYFLCIVITLLICTGARSQDTVIIIRHAEKPAKGDNLNCKGLNRSLQLPKLLSSRFRLPAYIYVPKLETGDETKHSRMFQTVTPFAVQYNLHINSSRSKTDSMGVAKDLHGRKGNILMVWEHHCIAPIARALGVKNTPNWPDDDYDSIWLITGAGTKSAKLTITHQGLNSLSDNCP